jgi:hypothetical protein
VLAARVGGVPPIWLLQVSGVVSLVFLTLVRPSSGVYG